ncbi:transient receptor potential channel pyrexia-like [Cloeon dipterum]|uniref:transient receptor potential channel pyrexia-like n=1 Tax=Cloeon dipterum TaxID=197152 RepID=UPI00321FC7EA
MLNVEKEALESIKMLVAKNCNINFVDNTGLTAIRLAALNGLRTLVEYLLCENGNSDEVIRGETTSEQIGDGNRNSLNGDSHIGHEGTCNDPRKNLVDALMNSGLPLNLKEQIFKDWLVNNDLELLKSTLKEPYKGLTLLEIAVFNYLPEMTQVLLEKGADPNQALILALDAGETFFDLLTKSSTQLDMSPKNSFDASLSQTFLHRAVMSERSSVKVVKYLLEESATNKSISQLINARDYLGMTALHHAANRNLNDVVEVLLQFNAKLFVKDNFNQPAFLDLEPEAVEEHLNKQIEQTTSQSFKESSIKFDFDVFLNHRCQRNQQAREKNACTIEMEPLGNCEKEPEENSETISDEDYCEMEPFMMLAESSTHERLLLHPLIRAFLQLKWKRVIWIYWLNFILCFIHGLISSLYVFSIFVKNSGSNETSNSTDKTNSQLNDQDDHFWYKLIVEYHSTIKNVNFVITFLLFTRELWQLRSFRITYFLKPVNWLDIIVIAGTFTILSTDPNEIDFKTIASTLFLFIAIEIMSLMSRHPQLATYIHMFFQVSKNFFKLLLWYFCLIIAFSFAFYIIFPYCEKGDDCKVFFNTIPSSIFKTIVMVTGEFETGNLGFEHVSGTGHLIYIAFLFFISMIMVNLLNGLAVSDTQEIKSNAELIFCKSQVKFFADIESSLLLKLPFLKHWLSKIFLVKRFLSTSNHTNTIIIYIRKDLPVDSGERSPFEIKKWKKCYSKIVSHALKIVNKNEENSKLDKLLSRMKILEVMIERKNNI